MEYVHTPRIDREIEALDKCWIEVPKFDYEFETYEEYLNRLSDEQYDIVTDLRID